MSAPGRTHVWLWKQARRVVVAVIGTTVLLIGVAMIVLPGPATVVIPCGLAILATEFVWARRWLDYAKCKVRELAARTKVIMGDGEKPETDARNQP